MSHRVVTLIFAAIIAIGFLCTAYLDFMRRAWIGKGYQRCMDIQNLNKN